MSIQGKGSATFSTFWLWALHMLKNRMNSILIPHESVRGNDSSRMQDASSVFTYRRGSQALCNRPHRQQRLPMPLHCGRTPRYWLRLPIAILDAMLPCNFVCIHLASAAPLTPWPLSPNVQASRRNNGQHLTPRHVDSIVDTTLYPNGIIFTAVIAPNT